MHDRPVALPCRLPSPRPLCLLIAGLLIAGAAHSGEKNASGDEKPVTIAQVQPLTEAEREQERLRKLLQDKPKAYVDKVMDAGTAQALAARDEAEAQASGNTRAWLVEGRLGVAQSDFSSDGAADINRDASEYGLRTGMRQSTLNWGEWDLQADFRVRHGDALAGSGFWGYASRDSSQRITLRNYALPVTSHVFADSALGDVYSDITDALARSYRLSLGTTAVRGASTHIRGARFDLRAGGGQRGYFVGSPYPGFERSTGNLAWLGASWRLPRDFYAGVQFNQAHGIAPLGYNFGALPGFNPPFLPGVDYNGPTEDVSSVAAAFGYGGDLLADGDRKFRVIAVHSRVTGSAVMGDASSANGVFLEAGVRKGRYRHEFGAYDSGPDLRFGDYLPLNDNRGAYWRVDYSASRLWWGLGLDYQQQNPDNSAGLASLDRIGLSGNAQWRLGRDSLVAGSVSVYNADYPAYAGFPRSGNCSVYLNAYYQTRELDWGRSRLSLTLRRDQAQVIDDVTSTGEQLEWEHDWITGKYETQRPEFSTILGYARDRSTGDTQTYPTAGIRLRRWLNPDWNLNANVHYSSRSGNLATSRGLSGTFGFEGRLSRRWTLGGYASLNQARVSVDQPALSPPLVSRSNDRMAYVYLRWESPLGSNVGPIGNREPGTAGSGALVGVVFFDANRDGRQQPDELGVQGVEVFLDGRYRTVTDRDGRYRFDQVATGTHTVSLRPESVPLPWGVTQNGNTGAQVPLRGETEVDLGVVRVGD